MAWAEPRNRPDPMAPPSAIICTWRFLRPRTSPSDAALKRHRPENNNETWSTPQHPKFAGHYAADDRRSQLSYISEMLGILRTILSLFVFSSHLPQVGLT